MTTKTLFFLALVLMIPVMATGAEMRTVNVDFSFTAPDDPALREHIGYRLYKEGEQVCETNVANTSRISCEVFTEEGTFDFTLMAYYSDYTESPPSPSFPLTIGPAAVTPPDEVTPPVVDDTPPPVIVDGRFKIEVGEVNIDHEWVRVPFEHTYSNPVIIAGPPTFDGENQAVVRIRNVNETGFEIRIQEWDYQDGLHVEEKVSYMVIDKGVYVLDNGSRMEAGTFTGSTSLQKVTLKQAYNVTPVIMTQVLTENEIDAVTNRVHNSNQSSFDHKMQEQERTQTEHTTETIGYVAWEPGQGQVGNLLYESALTAKNVNYIWFNLTFQTAFPELPFFFAGMQTTYNHDTAAIRSQRMSKTAVQIKLEEEQSKDIETRHVKEVVGYFSIGAAPAAIQ